MRALGFKIAARRVLFALAAFIPLSMLACQGCRGATTHGQPASSASEVGAEVPTLRLYLVSDLAGAIEPCGCVKDQLGGLDHLAAFVVSERKRVPASAMVAAGPLFFLDPNVTPEKKSQDVAKARTLASSLGHAGLVAFTPGRNDWAAGGDELERLRAESGASIVAGNLEGVPEPWRGINVRELGGVKIAFVGAASFEKAELGAPEGVKSQEVIPAIKRQVEAAKKQGARIVIALSATGRGEAKRIAESVPELTAVVVGAPSSRGEGNTDAPPAERIGNVIVAESGNHLTSAVVLDFHVRDGSFDFADATGLEEGRKRAALQRRVDELRGRIAQWESNERVARADIDARREELKKLEAERAAMELKPAPAKGSFFRYKVLEVRENLGVDQGVKDRLGQYYKLVNDTNRVAFADRKPRPVASGQPAYAGIEACDSCHIEEREVFDKTAHARAYPTLSKDHKEFNLDCVSCHVTGYDQPGGSTVVHVKGLENVQCEVCHGPGSLHVKNPKVAVPIPKPKPDQCLACHHPPHVHEFDAPARMGDVLGPGHGR